MYIHAHPPHRRPPHTVTHMGRKMARTQSWSIEAHVTQKHVNSNTHKAVKAQALKATAPRRNGVYELSYTHTYTHIHTCTCTHTSA